MINSQGKKVSQEHIDRINKENEYLKDLVVILNKRDDLYNGQWTNSLLCEYMQILIKHKVCGESSHIVEDRLSRLIIKA
jgi:hypothetical protein